MRKQSIFFIIAIYLISVLGSIPTQSVRAATLVVTNTDDSGTGSLRQAIADANGEDTITFDSSLSGQTIRLQSILIIDKNITIDGSALSEKITISGDSDNNGNGDVKLISITVNTVVTIKNIKFTKGYSSSNLSAGAIENLGNLSVYDSEFHFNSGKQGGAIRNSGNLYVEDSVFTNNTAQEGGAIANAINGTTTISNSTFTSNSTTGNGGAIYNSEGTVHITQSTFTSNSANYGGAIIAGSFPNGPNTTTTISESVISNNSANYGGGIEFDSGTSMTIDKTTISGNTAPAGGGIVNVSGNLLTITNSTVANNTSTQSPQPSGVLSLHSPVTIKNSTFTGNNHTSVGIQGHAIISNTTIAGNSGYGLEVYTYSLSITNSILANNGNFDCAIQWGATVNTNQNNLIETNSGCGTSASTSDPLLGPLADNGGLTQTMALSVDSPAINAGNNTTCESTDQRGISRPQDVNCDMGAYEVEFSTPTPTITPTLTPTFTPTPTATQTPNLPLLPAPQIPRTMFRLLTNDSTPSLSWLQVNGAFGYKITIASDKAFTNIVLNETVSTESFTPSTPLADGIYYWRVYALNGNSQLGKASAIQTLTIDTTPPAIPTLTSPMDGAELKRSPILRWTRVSGGVIYELQVSTSSDFSNPTTYTLRTNSRNLPALPDDVYYWRVRVKDAAGNWSDWSVHREFEIDR
ncbi:MAG: right-handed parallel beta-helix repeat-containing protein [Anaerolineales bacterium]|nr:right-handed parallel beta-helix repeat-containing protein [Anaerolineales bacterium]